VSREGNEAYKDTSFLSRDHWADIGNQVLQSPGLGPQAKEYAKAKGAAEDDPNVAAEWMRSTMSPETVAQENHIGTLRYYIDGYVHDRDTFGTQIAKQYYLTHPQATDADMYNYVRKNLLAAGKDSSVLPAFTIDPQTKAVITPQDRTSAAAGLLYRSAANVADLGKNPVEFFGRAFNQGMYHASAAVFGKDSQIAQQQFDRLQQYNLNTQAIDAAEAKHLPGSTYGQENPTYGMVEEGLAQVPSLLVLAGGGKVLGAASAAEAAASGASETAAAKAGATTAGRAIFGEVATQEFNGAYKKIYADGVAQGLDPKQAELKATMGAAVSSAVNTYLMKFGALGQPASVGLRAKLESALNGAAAQGGVAALQDLTRQASSYALTGKNANFEQTVQSLASGIFAGGIGSPFMPGHEQAAQGEQGAQVNTKPGPAAPDLSGIVQPSAQEAGSRQPVAPETTEPLPPSLEGYEPKHRVQDAAGSRGVAIKFASDMDKALYIATPGPDQTPGRRQKAATEWLAAQGVTPEQAAEQGQAVRAKVDAQAAGAPAEGVTIDRTHNIPYLGGTDTTGHVVYIDKDTPPTLKLTGADGKPQDVNPDKYLALHEDVEKRLMDKGLSYAEAHQYATAAENDSVKADGLNPEEYNKALEPFIKNDEHKRGNVPADLNKQPYTESRREVPQAEREAAAKNYSPGSMEARAKELTAGQKPVLPPVAPELAARNKTAVEKATETLETSPPKQPPMSPEVRKLLVEHGVTPREEAAPAPTPLEETVPGAKEAPIPARMKPALDAAGKLGQSNVIGFTGGEKDTRGFYQGDRLYVNVDHKQNFTPEGLRETVLHEAAHGAQETSGDLMQRLADAAPQWLKDSIQREYSKNYTESGGAKEDLTSRYLDREVVPMVVGKLMRSNRAFNEVFQTDRGLLSRGVDALLTHLRSYTEGGRYTNQVIAGLKELKSRVGAGGLPAETEAGKVIPFVQSGEAPSLLPATEKKAKKEKDLTALESTKLREEPLNSTKSMFGETQQAKNVKTEDVAKLLNARTKKLVGKAGSSEKSQIDRAIAAGIPETEYQLGQPDSGKDWYKNDLAKMEKTMIAMHPELAKPERMTIFKSLLAITSQGNKPNVNMKHAEAIYDQWEKTGKIPLTQPGGLTWPGTLGQNFKLPLGRLQALIDQKGEAGAADWLLQKKTVKDVNDFSASLGLNPNVSGKPTDPARGLDMFGPKIGTFAANIHGIQDKITKDMWFSRTWNRWMGTMFNANGEMQDAPRNDAEREVMDKAVVELGKRMNMDPSEVQAVLWYHEQQLFKAHGAKAESGSFSKAAERLSEPGVRYDWTARQAAVGQQGGTTPTAGPDAVFESTLPSNGAGGVERGVSGQPTGAGQAGEAVPAAAAEEPGAALPGSATVRKFWDEDLKSKAKDVGEAVSKAWEGIKSVVAPQTRTPEGQATAEIWRQRNSELAQRSDRINAAFDKGRKFLDTLPVAETRDMIDRIERGMPQARPELQPTADAIRQVFDDRLKQVQALGTGKLTNFIQDYFPHLWEDPAKAQKVYASAMAKAPLEGKKGFLKARTLPFFSDGIAAGLTPVTENPVDMMRLRAREMDKYITAHQALQEMDQKGLLQYVRATGKTPDGYSRINDNIATVYAPPGVPGSLSIAGYRVAPDAVANVVNNQLSPGLRGNKYFGGAFRGFLGAGNLMNSVQLGLSGFHLAMTSMDSATSKLALGLRQLGEGQFKEAAKSAGMASTVLGPAVENIMRGNKMLREWFNPGSTDPETAQLVKLMKEGGGRAKMDDFYHTGVADKMMEAYRKGNYLGAALRAPAAAIELAGKPLMEKIVPRMKMGVFMDLAKFEMQRLGPNATPDQLRSAAGKAWDSVDNRMGQLVYDNLFWNKAAKDLAMASTRSVGWNLGTIRELGGGALDFSKAGLNLVRGRNASFTHRMAYTAAMPVMSGLVGGMMHYMLNGKAPDELKDWFFPKTGTKDNAGHDMRYSLPTYMKDVYAYAKSPSETLKNKVHPLVHSLWDMMSNQDYYGAKIRNEDDPIMKQLADVAKFGAKQFTPFSMKQLPNVEKEGPKALLPLIGITPARRDITYSPAELKASDLIRARVPQGMRTQEQVEKSNTIRDLATGLRTNAPTAREDIQAALRSGKILPADFQAIKQHVKFSGLTGTVHSLDMHDAMSVWSVATPEEKKTLGPTMFAKLRATQSITREQKVGYLNILQNDWKELKAGAQPAGADNE
jgi:hypothetical protein